jgi:hypothetical protein
MATNKLPYILVIVATLVNNEMVSNCNNNKKTGTENKKERMAII